MTKPSKPRVHDPKTLADYLEAEPSRMACWRDGLIGRYPLLTWLDTYPTLVANEHVQRDGVNVGLWSTTTIHQNQVGVAVAWIDKHMKGRKRGSRTRESHRRHLFASAEGYWVLRDLLGEIYQGIRGLEVKGDGLVLPFTGDRRLYALDRLLSLVDDFSAMDDAPRQPNPALGAWMHEQGRETPWSDVPEWASQVYRGVARAAIEKMPSYLPNDLEFGLFTLAEASRVLTELLAMAMHQQAATLSGSVNPLVVTPITSLDRLTLNVAAATDVDVSAVRAILDLLTLDLARCSDPCLTPLVPLGGDLVLPMSTLIVASSAIRNLTALLQKDPAQFGRAGQVLGRFGASRVADTLRTRLRNVLITTGVKVMRANGQQAGDLDVVVCDAAARELTVLEVLWRIGPDGSFEVAEVERVASEKQQQVWDLRAAIDSGSALPRWPHGWPDVGGFKWNWFVVTPQTLPARRAGPTDVVVRSHQMLARMLKKDSTHDDLVKLLTDPPIPPTASQQGWARISFGALSVEFDKWG